MKKYHDNIVYFISYSKLPSNTPAAIVHGFVGCGLFIDITTSIVEDVSCTLLTDEARLFLKELITGFNCESGDIDELCQTIHNRYHGHAQKAICTTLKDSQKKYLEWLKKKTLEK